MFYFEFDKISNTIFEICEQIHRLRNTPLFKAMLKTVSRIPGLARCMMVHTLLVFHLALVPF